MKNISYICLILALSGCSVAPKYVAPNIDVPEDKTSGNPFIEFVKANNWWCIFEDEKLNALELQALKNNHDLIIAMKNVEEAANALKIANSALLPNLSGSYSNTRSFLSTDGTRKGMAGFRDTYDHQAGLNLSYEVDIFGKNRDASRAQLNQLFAIDKNREALFLSLTSTIAKTYFSLLSIDAQLIIARKTLQTRKKTYEMFTCRYKNGICKELDLRRIEAEKLSVESKVLALESAKNTIESTLALLTGASVKGIVEHNIDSSRIDKVKLIDNVLKDIPSEMLLKRPDIAAAEYELKAANANIGVARAAFFPSLSLTGIVGSGSSSFSSLFSGPTSSWQFGGTVGLPIFNAGKLAANERIAKIRFEKAVQNYQKTVKTAFKEACDAIMVNNQNRKILEAIRKRSYAIKRSYSLAQQQEKEGLIGLIDLLDVERNLLAVQMEHVQAFQDSLNSAVDLCKAIGCGINGR